MRAMVLTKPGEPLTLETLPRPEPGRGQLAVRVEACGVCRTDLHIVDGELSSPKLPSPKLPLVLGHQIVGVVEELGPGVDVGVVGDRVGIPWLGWTCGVCEQCRGGAENLCDRARFTGYLIDGGYAATS